jgi:hypothetical protein
VDLTNIQSVEEAFIQVTKAYGPPSVVLYNGKCYLRYPRYHSSSQAESFNAAATVTFPKDFANPFATIEPEAFVKDLNLNLVGAYVAIKKQPKVLTSWVQMFRKLS